MRSQSRWALILAGGDGRRLRPLTRQIAGDDRPKQFCRLVGAETLLEQTQRRVARLISPARTLVVVVGHHERFYAPAVADGSSPGLVIQPDNRGTAPAILYGLLRVSAMTPEGSVAIFPSDHFVSDDEAFAGVVGQAFEVVEAATDLVVLLGVVPQGGEMGYGWIEPGGAISSPVADLHRVRRFWEKPSAAVAHTLLARGCLWNSFVMIGGIAALLALIEGAAKEMFERFVSVRARLGTPEEAQTVRPLYAQLPSTDFSREVLARSPTRLAVLRLKDIVWSDLGEPRRVAATLARIQAECGAGGHTGEELGSRGELDFGDQVLSAGRYEFDGHRETGSAWWEPR